jgi:hypothetical protein
MAAMGARLGRFVVRRQLATRGATVDALEHTRSQYVAAGGCAPCLAAGVYRCPDRALCAEPQADHRVLETVREHLLDAADLRSDRDKTEFQYPGRTACAL